MEIARENYMINEKTVLLTGEYDKYGRLLTRVIEGEDTFLVKRSPVEVINMSLVCLGSDFHAARRSSKKILGTYNMHPIKVNCSLGIWLFPTKSYRNDHCVWFSLVHVKKSKAFGVRQTTVYLSYNHEFELDMRESSFISKKNKAEELRDNMTRNAQSPMTFYLEAKPGIKIKEGKGINRYTLK